MNATVANTQTREHRPTKLFRPRSIPLVGATETDLTTWRCPG